jgi:methylmalonyl-CoA/ethylmalonyl-CoA epimerase
MGTDADGKSPFTHLIQIGVVVKDIEQAIERLSILGIGPFYSKMPPPEAQSLYRGQPFSAAGRVIIKASRMGNVELELIQPVEGGSPHKEYLDEKGEGIQHIAFAVDNLGDEVNKLTTKGCTMLLDGRRDGGGVAYLDLNVGGIIVELIGRKSQ